MLVVSAEAKRFQHPWKVGINKKKLATTCSTWHDNCIDVIYYGEKKRKEG
jgi:hypothetical protein